MKRQETRDYSELGREQSSSSQTFNNERRSLLRATKTKEKVDELFSNTLTENTSVINGIKEEVDRLNHDSRYAINDPEWAARRAHLKFLIEPGDSKSDKWQPGQEWAELAKDINSYQEKVSELEFELNLRHRGNPFEIMILEGKNDPTELGRRLAQEEQDIANEQNKKRGIVTFMTADKSTTDRIRKEMSLHERRIIDGKDDTEQAMIIGYRHSVEMELFAQGWTRRDIAQMETARGNVYIDSQKVEDSEKATMAVPPEIKTIEKQDPVRKALRKKELVESQPFMTKQDISSKTMKLSEVAKDIPESLLFDNLRCNSSTIAYLIKREYNRLKNTSKMTAAFQLDKKLSDIESFHTRPTTHIDIQAREEISFALIETHHLLTDLSPDWLDRFPQLQSLHTHIDTELKKLRDQNV